MPIIKKVTDNAKKLYPSVRYAWASVPTYPSGLIGFVLCGQDSAIKFGKPKRTFASDIELRYYTPAVHEAAFVLPKFCAEGLDL